MVWLLLAAAFSLAAAEVNGVVSDSAGRPVSGARVAVMVPAGVVTEQITDNNGVFDIYVSPLYENVTLRVTARGFQTSTVGMGAARIQLTPQAQADAAPAVTSTDLRERNEAQAADLMRETPGVLLNQRGARGSFTDLSIRGGDPRDNVVLLDGIPINSFHGGGLLDFARIPSDLIEQIDVSRGPQSALYGSYAMTGAVNLITRAPSDGASFDALAEGGTHGENRVSLGGSGMPARDWGIAGSLSHLGGGDYVGDYVNDSIYLATSWRWRTQDIFAFGDFDSSQAGKPENKNNVSVYGLHWQDAITDNLRADAIAGFVLDNSLFKDIRAYGEGKLTYSFGRHWKMEGGYAFTREETRGDGVPFLIRRDDDGIYVENQIAFGQFHINAGLREDIYPLYNKLNPRISGAYTIDATTSLHASYATGIRPPGGLELALNPAFQPERTKSYDVGVTKRLLSNRLSIDGAWFRNRYEHLIEAPDATGKGVDASAHLLLTSWFSATGNYMFLETALPGRPKHSGSLVAMFHFKRLDTQLLGYFRAPHHSYENLGVNVNFRVREKITVYANVRNALDERYEEVYGYPAPLLNFVSGIKWSLARAR